MKITISVPREILELRPMDVVVPAFSSGVAGIVIHRTVAMGGQQIGRNSWRVTHAASGFAITGAFCSRAEAKVFARSIKKLADWSLPGEKLGKDLVLLRKVFKARQKYNANHPACKICDEGIL